jgi:hypothetical protein
MRALSRIRLNRALALLLLSMTLAACGGEEPPAEESPSPAAVACGGDALGRGVISNLQVDVLEEGKAQATYVLTQDAEVGIVISRLESEGDASRLQLVGRVPFGPQRSTVVNRDTFNVPSPGGQPLEPGEYEFKMRAFEAGKLNQGDPIDTRAACVTIE